MTNDQLQKANKIQQEINELEKFLSIAENVWTGKIVKRTSKYILKSNPYGIYDEATYLLDTDLKNKVLNVLKERLLELKKQLYDL